MQTRRKYTSEYKHEAVQLVISSGQSIRQVAGNLGIRVMKNWRDCEKSLPRSKRSVIF
ncbi:transposase [Oxalobacter vibrioformis]|uniref:Transposase n=1 Tax=Oxalobacter vibrioformis TaxID=933080 RepID=A0A9E9LZ54_9BURK|nr:transposase [Oxalobacter vibrioformis]WAW10237.1 transposase [Oxalobacter vibrioformis]